MAASSTAPVVDSAPKPPASPAVNSASLVAKPAQLPEPEIVHIPSYSKWFSWDDVHECEVRYFTEFFGDAPSPLKNPSVYFYYRNSIISKYRERPSRKLTFTEARKTIIGDVGLIRRVFDFLETWGLVNYIGWSAKQPLKWEDKESKAPSGGQAPHRHSGDAVGVTPDGVSSKRWCSGCKALCSIACFASDKYNLTLCARCYVRGNYRTGIMSADFRRVEINEATRSNWSDKETLHLLEAVFHYDDDWKRVAEHVGSGRTEKDCVARFIKLPAGQELVRQPGPEELGNLGDQEFGHDIDETLSAPKKMHLNPLADAGNPVMAQAAFLSALAGTKVAEFAAQAAVAALSEGNHIATKRGVGALSNDIISKGSGTEDVVHGNANSVLVKEQKDLERVIMSITDVHMKHIEEKIEDFEEFDLYVDKDRKPLQQMKDLLFTEQLGLKFHKPSIPRTDKVIARLD